MATIEEQLKAIEAQEAEARAAARKRGEKKAALLREKKLADLEGALADLEGALDQVSDWLRSTQFARMIDGHTHTKSAMEWYELDVREQTPDTLSE